MIHTIRTVAVGDHNNQEESNFEDNTFVTHTLIDGFVSSPVMWNDSFSDVNVIYKNITFKNNKDEFGNVIVVETSSSGCLPTGSLICLVEGRGLGKYLSCILQREETSSNYTVTSKTAVGCDITFANSVGSLGGTNLSGMEFIVTVYK